ncbi:ribonucleoside-triphosphate reductase, adenosylcobalamin-dependent [Clostridium perfringens]|uniref:Adenosylcobalamin-dependent ribonucleoside-triphosphate reductase n=1 Tax=Clostridium perfringens TaxID=1502 RepID=A0A140GRV6_CLOPF|nr:ribonucleoside-triphosphate reductase, adenosylcobalamin-dependent [Clostridium perfringens]AMN31265.1 Ribonucleotide reductase of class II (coenzyme B12-dependent) [Clostridium perfringens]TBX14237.1 ribonucleoside-triphosphate reductase, adenosylcobalamin-dependent [Clostridium perfringens]
MNYISDKFIEKYKKIKAPFTELGEFVYLRTYSRYISEKKRREYWHETCERVANYSVSLLKQHNPKISDDELREEAELIFDNMFNLRTFPSGRTMWVGNTKVAEECKLGNFNCSFTVINSFSDFKELFYLAMVGSGTGLRILKDDVKKIQPYKCNKILTSKHYTPVYKSFRSENTSLNIRDNVATIIVGDSKYGWIEALDFYFKLLTDFSYSMIKEIHINYDNVRPKGEKLKTFGGHASGHESLKNMFEKIHVVMKRANGKLKPIDVLDIANIIGENVVSGGVRRTAQIALFDSDDDEVMEAKSNLYIKDENGDYIANDSIIHRRMSNNSIFFNRKPSRIELHEIFNKIRYTGEPGFINAEAGRKRRENFEGMNPCAEILLDSKECCNLTTTNLMAFVKDGCLDKENLLKILKLSTRIGIRMTLAELEIAKWDEIQKRDRLIGVSITGYQDMVNSIGLNMEEQAELLREMRVAVHNEAEEYSSKLGIPKPILATTVKPEGTISQLPTVSSGVHYSHSPYYIRRIRINSSDPLCRVLEELEYPVFPEVGESEEDCNTKVVEFPVKSPIGKTKHDVSAIDQLEIYKMFMRNWTDHNTSITVHVREHEWKDVEEWVWNNWDEFVGVSFLALYDSVYPLLPYEAITKEEYEQRKSNMKPFDSTLLCKYELEEEDLDIGNEGCEGGICPIR